MQIILTKNIIELGHLFEGRFKSKNVEGQEYILNLIRYIHQNPQKAGISKIIQYNWSSYQRTNEYLGISGTVESNNSFGQKVKSSVFVAFKLQEDMLSLIYVEINGTGVYGTKVSVEVPRVERKVENTSTDNSITLKDGTLGTYGKYDIMDGNQYIRYYIPNGKYKVTALVKNSMFYVESIAIHKENGYDTPTTYNTINLKNKNDTQNIEITDGQCISLVMGTRIKLEKIN